MRFVWILSVEKDGKVRLSRAFKSPEGAQAQAVRLHGCDIAWRTSRRVVCSPLLGDTVYSIHHYRLYP